VTVRTADCSAFTDAARDRVDLAGSSGSGRTSCRSSAPSPPGACARTTSSACCRGTGAPPRSATRHAYGRIAKTLHILRLADEPGYGRQIKGQANLQESRHSLARKIFHGRQRAALPGRYGGPDRGARPGPPYRGPLQHAVHGRRGEPAARGRLRHPTPGCRVRRECGHCGKQEQGRRAATKSGCGVARGGPMRSSMLMAAGTVVSRATGAC
jgi:hypothetical protein